MTATASHVTSNSPSLILRVFLGYVKDFRRHRIVAKFANQRAIKKMRFPFFLNSISLNLKELQATLTLWPLLFLLICSSALNVFLARKIGELNGKVIQVKLELKTLTKLSAGDSVPPFLAKDIMGRDVDFSYSDKASPIIFYTFTPSCIWCKRNLTNVKALAEKMRGKYFFSDYRFQPMAFKTTLSQIILSFQCVRIYQLM